MGNEKIMNATALIAGIGIANFVDFNPAKNNISVSNIGMYGKLVMPTVTFHKNELGAGKITKSEISKKKIAIISLIIFQYTNLNSELFLK